MDLVSFRPAGPAHFARRVDIWTEEDVVSDLECLPLWLTENFRPGPPSPLTGSGLRLDLEDGSIVINPDRDQLVGPEIAFLRGFDDGSWRCWRPGEDSFESLA